MAAVWPVTLPQVVLMNGYSEEPIDDTLRSEVDSGPPEARALFTGLMCKKMLPLLVTSAQKVTLRDFYDTTLNRGSLRFEWSSYHTGNVTKEHFFNSKPQFSVASGTLWYVTLDVTIFDLSA